MTDFAIQDTISADGEQSLLFVAEGTALSTLRLDPNSGETTVLSRVSPNQGRIQGVAISEKTAFVITPIGLAAIDIQNPLEPVILNFLPGGGEAIATAGDFAFIAARAAGLRIVNISNPSQLVLASTFPLPGKALAIELDTETKLAYVATDEAGLRIIDISAPDLPREVASMELADGAQQLLLQDDTLYLSSGDRILIADTSRPGTPVRVNAYAPPRQAHRAAVSGDYAYVADLDGGLKVFSIADRADPLLIFAETNGSSYDVLVAGNRAYLADGPAGIRILNINDPGHPQTIAQLPLDGIAQGLALWEDTLLVAAGEAGLYVIQLANERSPIVIGQLDTAGDARDVSASEHVAYLADGPAGLAIISMLDRTAPELRGSLYVPGEAQALDIAGTFVYVVANDGGLQIIDAIRPAAPYLVGTLSLPDGQRAVDIELIVKRAYLAIQGETEDETGLAIADVGFRDHPVILSRVAGPGDGVAVQGTAPLTVGGTGLMTIDARASSGPVLEGYYRPPTGAGGIDWQANTLYLTSRNQGPEMTLIDVADPLFPQERLHLGVTPAGGRVEIRHDRVYLATGQRGLRTVNTGTGQEPVEQVIYDPMDTLTHLDTFANELERIYGAGEAGWSMTSVQDPELPQPLSRVETEAQVYGLAKNGDRLYATTATHGLLIYDLGLQQTGIPTPQRLGSWSDSTALRDVHVYRGYLYLADQLAGLQVIDPTPPEAPNLLQTLPLIGTPERIIPLAGTCTDPVICQNNPPEWDRLAYILTGSQDTGIRLVDLGDPTLGMTPLGKFQAQATTVQVNWPYAYTLDGTHFSVWELPEPGEPLANFTINGSVLLLAGNKAYVGSQVGHISIVNISDPSDPRVLGMMGNGAAVRGLALYGTHLIAGLESIPAPGSPANAPTAGSVRVWDVADSHQPEELFSIQEMPPFSAMDVQGEQIVVAGPSLTILDASAHPTVTISAAMALPARGRSLFLDGDLAYVGTDSGLAIVAGLGNNTPYLYAQLTLDQAVTSIVVQDGRGYLALRDQGGLIVDLSNPASPHAIAGVISPTGGPAREFSLVGQQLFAVWDNWISWLDISQHHPGPTEVSSFSLAGITPNDLVIRNKLAYLTDRNAGLLTLDISDPTRPTLLGELDTPGQTYAIAVSPDGQLGYLADGECGLRVISLDPQQPSALAEVGFWHTGYALDVVALEDRVYVADVGELFALAFDATGEPHAPQMPRTPSPADDAMFYQDSAILSWQPPASHCDPLSYDLYLGIDNPPPLVASGLSTPTFKATDLERWQSYYWRVVAHDRQGDVTQGPLWQFHIRTNSQPPPTPIPPPRPELARSPQNDVMPVVGALLAAGFIAAMLWWVWERRTV